jgi:hypothetical protein
MSAGDGEPDEPDRESIDAGTGEQTADVSSEDKEAPNSPVIGDELRDGDASDEQLLSGGVPD